MGISIQIHLPEKLYLRDPEQTDLGRRIIDFSIKLIDELGFEKFTFKKLATAISSTEASVYRYFENKHKLLIYLVSWYWRWLEYQIDYQIHNVEDKKRIIELAIGVLADSIKYDPNFSHIDEVTLHRIVVEESSKAFLTKQVNKDRKDGLFGGYRNLCLKLASILSDYNPSYPYPKALASTVVEASHQQIFFAEHLPDLTNLQVEDEDTTQIAQFLEDLVFRVLEKR